MSNKELTPQEADEVKERIERRREEVSKSRRNLLKFGAAAGLVAAAGPFSKLKAAQRNPLDGGLMRGPVEGTGIVGSRSSQFSADGNARLVPETNNHGPLTFGSTYQMHAGHELQPFYLSTYTNDGNDALYPVSGNSFYYLPIEIPDGSTLERIKVYYINNVASSQMSFWLYQSDPSNYGGGSTSLIGIWSTPGTAATTLQITTIDSSATPAFNPTTLFTNRYVYWLGVGFGTLNNAQHAVAGIEIGYSGPIGTLFLLPQGDRYVDTRPGPQNRGGLAAPFTSIGNTFDFTLGGATGRDGTVLPFDMTAVIGNVTAVSPSTAGLFKLLPGGAATTIGTSAVNFNAGFNTANAFTARLNSAQQLRAFYSGTGQSDLLIDIVGYYRTW